jgi:tetratricopeptide (TPR) repeat protein
VRILLNSVFFFFAIKILGAPAGLSSWIFHTLAGVFILPSVPLLASRYIFWVLILISFFFSSESRFSLEYLLLAMGFFVWGAHPFWKNLSTQDRSKALAFIFLGIFISTKFGLIFSEPGSFYFLVPAWLAINFSKPEAISFFTYSISGFLLIISNKTSILLGYLVSLLQVFKNKYIYLASGVLIFLSFFLGDSVEHFISKSFLQRLGIWGFSIYGFFQAPLFGYGFGTFSIDFPVFRSHGDIFGSKVHQHIVHGHSLLTHVLFEQGILGLFFLCILFYLIFKKARPAFLPFLLVSLADATLVSFSQYLLLGLFFLPLILRTEEETEENKIDLYIKKLFLPVPLSIRPISVLLGFLLVIYIFLPSCLGHFYYDQKDFDRAIEWDKKNALYYFMRGSRSLNKDTPASEQDLTRAVELSPSISYFYGFLAAAQLSNGKTEEAKKNIAMAIEYDGADPYWQLLSAFINYDNKALFQEHYELAVKKSPIIEELLLDPSSTASEYIGSEKSDVRISSFYRRGPKVFLPLPYLEKLPEFY